MADVDRGCRSPAGHLVGAVHRGPRFAGRNRASRVARAASPNGKPLWGMFNPSWGGGRDGVMYALDTTQPEVVAHLEHVARSLVDAGLHLLEARLHVRAELRRGVGRRRRTRRPSGCAPAMTPCGGERATTRSCSAAARRSSHVSGVVDGNRIGPDVAPSWEPPAGEALVARIRHERAGDVARVDRHALAQLHASAPLVERSGLPHAAYGRDGDDAGCGGDVGAGGGGVGRHGVGLRRSGAARRTIRTRLLDDVVHIGRQVDAASAARSGAAVRGPARHADPDAPARRGL